MRNGTAPAEQALLNDIVREARQAYRCMASLDRAHERVKGLLADATNAGVSAADTARALDLAADTPDRMAGREKLERMLEMSRAVRVAQEARS